MKRILISALLGVSALVAAVPAVQAQGIQLDERGLRLVPRERERERVIIERRGREEIGRREAVDIARDQGMLDVDEVVRTGDRWRVVGEDRRGRELRVVIDADSGRVLRVTRGGF